MSLRQFLVNLGAGLLASVSVSAANISAPLFAWHLDISSFKTLGLPAISPKKAQIAIIIDDLGYSYTRDKPFIDFPANLTLAVIPFTPHGRQLSLAGHNQGKEIMLHAPMETIGQRDWESSSLGVAMNRDELLQSLSAMLQNVPYVQGVNNHGGSLLTQDPTRMEWLMSAVSARGLYFVDSRTTAQSVAYETASSFNVVSGVRDVFLDNTRDTEEIRTQFNKLLQIALTEGKAMAIGHPHPETLQVLREEVPRLELLGIELVPVSDYLGGVLSEVDWMNRISASKTE